MYKYESLNDPHFTQASGAKPSAMWPRGTGAMAVLALTALLAHPAAAVAVQPSLGCPEDWDQTGLVQIAASVSSAPSARAVGAAIQADAKANIPNATAALDDSDMEDMESDAMLKQLVLTQLAVQTMTSRIGAMAEVATKRTGMSADCILSTVLASLLGAFILSSLIDYLAYLQMQPHKNKEVLGGPTAPALVADETTQPRVIVQPRSILAICGLTFYRFYTGFMSATWLPYLLAKEGAELWEENQALFMGIVKLLYGASILLNPLFGLLGDRVASMNYAVGRRIFVRTGIIMAGFGILCCHFAAPRGLFKTFFFGIVVWRVGEGLNDVTTEAICPEMLPKEQFEISSAIRASMFLVGGLVGYVMVACFTHMHYSWLYHGFLMMMLVCAIPSLLLIRNDVPNNLRRQTLNSKPFLVLIREAYYNPTQYKGGFPCGCLCIFLFSLGSAPMFFMLLILRDLVGITNHILLDTHFSLVSIAFFLSAAVAAAMNALGSPRRSQQQRTEENKKSENSDTSAAQAHELNQRSFQLTAFSIFFFGAVVISIPFLKLFQAMVTRMWLFYFMSAFMGAGFGCAYARFQDCNWQLLPPNVDTANAMGFSTMCKLLGAGLGNFAAGLILDLFQTANSVSYVKASHHGITTDITYSYPGYLLVCGSSAFCVILTGALVLTIPAKQKQSKAPRAG